MQYAVLFVLGGIMSIFVRYLVASLLLWAGLLNCVLWPVSSPCHFLGQDELLGERELFWGESAVSLPPDAKIT